MPSNSCFDYAKYPEQGTEVDIMINFAFQCIHTKQRNVGPAQETSNHAIYMAVFCSDLSFPVSLRL